MKIVCHGCGELLDDNSEKFCNDICRDHHIEKLEKIVKEAVKNDPNHTQKLSLDF